MKIGNKYQKKRGTSYDTSEKRDVVLVWDYLKPFITFCGILSGSLKDNVEYVGFGKRKSQENNVINMLLLSSSDQYKINRTHLMIYIIYKYYNECF